MALAGDRLQRKKLCTQLDQLIPNSMKNMPIIPMNTEFTYRIDSVASMQAHQLAAIQIPETTELIEEELRLWYYLAPFAVDRLRVHYGIEEVHANFSDYLPPRDSLIEELVAANALAYLSDIEFAPTADAVDGGLLAFAKPVEVGDSDGHSERVTYFTLRGILWLLKEFGSEPHPYRHMAHPGELLANHRVGLSNE